MIEQAIRELEDSELEKAIQYTVLRVANLQKFGYEENIIALYEALRRALEAEKQKRTEPSPAGHSDAEAEPESEPPPAGHSKRGYKSRRGKKEKPKVLETTA